MMNRCQTLSFFGFNLILCPYTLGEDVTPAAARAALRSGDARRALLMALRLKGADGDGALVRDVLEGTPPDAVAGALQGFPAALLAPMLEALSHRVAVGPHAQLMLRWGGRSLPPG